MRYDKKKYGIYFIFIILLMTCLFGVFFYLKPSIAYNYDEPPLLASSSIYEMHHPFYTQSKWDQFIDYLEKISSVKKKDLQTLHVLEQEEEQQNVVNEKIRLLFQAFVLGSIFIIGINHLVVYFHRKKELSALFIALACFGVVTRTFFIKETLFINLFFDFKPESLLIVDLITGLVSILFYLLYINREFIRNRYRFMTNFFVSCVIIYIICMLVFPLEIILQTNYIYQLLALFILIYIVCFSIIAGIKRMPGAYLNLIGLLILFVLVWNDFFHYSEHISTNEFISVSILFYLFFMTIHLSRKSSYSFERVERLSEELGKLNLILELKVKQRTEELQIANESLQKVEESRRRLLASVSHELNTPLTFIHGHVKAMLDGIVPKDDTTYLRAVYNDTKMMTRMIADLQELSILESGQYSFHFKEVDMKTFIVQMYEELQPLFNGKDLHFIFKESIGKETNILCSIDPIRIKQVLTNLIVNAQKFTPKGGSIYMETVIRQNENEKKEVKLTIMDTGIGIDEKNIPYLFERFFKLNEHQYCLEKGSGLGLVISKEIVEIHGGMIGVTSQKNKGSKFYFTLPIRRD